MEKVNFTLLQAYLLIFLNKSIVLSLIFFENFHIFVQIIKILGILRFLGHVRDPKAEDHGYSTTLGINAPKSVPFKYENNAQTLPEQL